MSTEKTVAHLDAILRGFDELRQIPVPRNVREVVESDWVQSADTVLGVAVGGYLSLHKSEDKTRVISTKAMLSVLSDLEQQLVQNAVLDPGHILWVQIESAGSGAKYFVTHLPEIWRVIWRAILEGDLVAFVFRNMVRLAIVAAVKSLAVTMMKSRDGIAEKMRKRAFPQSGNQRHWRRKATRRWEAT